MTFKLTKKSKKKSLKAIWILIKTKTNKKKQTETLIEIDKKLLIKIIYASKKSLRCLSINFYNEVISASFSSIYF